MPVFKPISGHTGLRRCKSYLMYGKGEQYERFKGGGFAESRAIGVDFVNIYGERCRRDWDKVMDATRDAAGNGLAVKGERATTFRHFIVSPDPRDDVSLDKLRRLCLTFAERKFGVGGELGPFQVAIVYHDDNSERMAKGLPGIPHAHIVVNNTNLETDARLAFSPSQWRALREDLEEIARGLGLTYFNVTEGVGEDGRKVVKRKLVKPTYKDFDARWRHEITWEPQETKQNIYRTKVEREMRAKGQTTWKDELRQMIDISCNLSRTMEEFRENLARMGVVTEERKRRNDNKHDLIFYYPQEGVPLEENKRKVGGERLGRHYTNPAIQGKMRLAYYQKLSANDRDPGSVINLVKEVNVVTIKKGADVALVDISRAFAAINGDRVNSVEDAKKLLVYAKSTLANHEGKGNYQSYVNQVRNLEALIKVAKVTNILPPASDRPLDWRRAREEREAARKGEKVSLDHKVNRGWHLTDEERASLKRSNPLKYQRWKQNFRYASLGKTELLRRGGGRKGSSSDGDGGGRSHGGGEARSRLRSR